MKGEPSRKAQSDRHGWRSRRNRFVRRGHDFCIVCGFRSGRLEVHHLEGYRNVHYDDLSTVVTTCSKHHKLLERFTKAIAGLDARSRRDRVMVLLGFLGDRWAFFSGRALAEEEDA